jgi:DNA-binding GntR family transcriptional regulator
MHCELAPGQKLVISDIANQLEVSTIPVREALQLLQSEDLVEYNAHVGALVTPITEASVAETFTIKEGLESVAVRIGIEKMTQSTLEQLKKQLEEMDQVLKSERFEKWGQLNAQFHRTIVVSAEMPLLKEMHLKILDKWDRIRRYFFSEVLINRHGQSQEEHEAIVEAIENGDISKAEQLTRSHNRNALKDYMEHFKA